MQFSNRTLLRYSSIFGSDEKSNQAKPDPAFSELTFKKLEIFAMSPTYKIIVGIIMLVVGGVLMFYGGRMINNGLDEKKEHSVIEESKSINTGDINAGGDVNLVGGDMILNINIASVEKLQKRIDRLEKKQEKSLANEKVESCFAPGIKELEIGRKLLKYGEEAKAKHHLKEAIKFLSSVTRKQNKPYLLLCKLFGT